MDRGRSAAPTQALALLRSPPMVGDMSPVTFRSPAVTGVAAIGAAYVATAACRMVGMRVPVVRVLHVAPTSRLSSPARTGRGPPRNRCITKRPPGRSYQASALFFFSVKGRGRP
ncbi:hypothetical protein MILUP08_41903 [Micromonospora lupini str. Lupac 08]|uniref:Uncharacterized protein n=1 Tax=Micromonospora lupini str. Lupac 08 TaxID=1150864 RepID=I0KZI8_9ACTN|nr:hypothetical protein MILUP08_41903 [Micromonospora lupini str. Lupac 08]